MGISGGQPRIPPQGLNERTYASLLRSAWRLERRTDAGLWTLIRTYGDEHSAATALDEAVGEGRGTASDYRIIRARRGGGGWIAVGVAAVVALAVVSIVLIASW
jgi:hypothetical protein